MLNNFLTLFFFEAARALLRHRVRSGLTALGIIVGIAAVVLVIAIGQAGSAQAQLELAKLGDNLVWIEAGSRTSTGVRTGTHGATSLTLDDEEAIVREVPLIKRCSPQIDGTIQVVHGNRNWTTRFRGETPDYLEIKKWGVVEGVAFSDEDTRDFANRILIGRTAREQLFGTENAVGEFVRVNKQPFEVIGVLEPKGQNADGRDQDDWVLLPYTTASAKLRGKNMLWLDDILCSAVRPEAVKPAIESVISLLRQRHQLGPGDEDDFNIRRPDEVLKAQLETSNTLAALLLAIASVSLLVGGIGIMNMMLASVTQRTLEIGIRLAVGATPAAIWLQFLGEAVVLSLVGGVLGTALSLVGAAGFERGLGWPMPISIRAVAVAVASSVAVGVFFGFYPAWRGSRLDPIEALRHQ